MKFKSTTGASLALLLNQAIGSAARHHGPHAQLSNGLWKELSPIPQPWQEGSVAAIGDRVYIIGGITSNYSYTPSTTNQPSTINTTTLVQYFDIQTQTWHKARSMPISINHGNVASVGGLIYMLGGLSGANLSEWSGIANSYVYNPVSDSWTEIAPMPEGSARGACAVGVRGSEIYLAGGMTTLQLWQDGLQASVSTVTSYNTVTNTWTTTHAPLPGPRDHVAGAVIGDTFYVTGGRDHNQFNWKNNTWALNLHDSSEGLASAKLGEYLFTFGGEGNPNDPVNLVFSNTEVYDAENDEWHEMSPLSIRRHGTGAVAVGGKLYMPGGGVKISAAPTDAMSMFDPWMVD